MDKRCLFNNGRYDGYGASSPGPPNQGGNMAPSRQEAPRIPYDYNPALDPNIHPEVAAQLASVGSGPYDLRHFNGTRGIAPRQTVYRFNEEEIEDEAGQGYLGKQPNTGPHHHQPATVAPNDTVYHVKNEYQDQQLSEYKHADGQHYHHHQQQQQQQLVPAHALPHRPQHQVAIAPMQTIYSVDPNQGMHEQQHPHQQQQFQQPIYPPGSPDAIHAELAQLHPAMTPEQRAAWIRDYTRIKAEADKKRWAEEQQRSESEAQEAFLKIPGVEDALDKLLKVMDQLDGKKTSDTADRIDGAGAAQGGEKEEQLNLDDVVYEITELLLR
ncbi:hypothetical protein QBC37DRAFT_375902 [Rhypophila decipiens]|uniref:Uncharacterized protein n=1 Tax=Rhypophila decipiens TaxID=261697 RepID=A0AAN6Y2R7_9PEZI|nr:hypothetical protein QBC37DRAFT_375902 [Rhypophila decipiens]